MLRAVLFDLDDTLLANSMDAFLPAYFQALTRYLEPMVAPGHLTASLMQATKVMDQHLDRALTNEEAFASAFYPQLDYDRAGLESAFERFYAEEFPKLRRLTRLRPEARLLVESALAAGLQVGVATNPMFPRVAVEERLAWAGVPVEQIGYALVTTYENMHATKSHHDYYREIAEVLRRRPGECLMVGDSWNMDIVPASTVGFHVYWVSKQRQPAPPGVRLVGRGTLADLWAHVQGDGWSL
jgi:FMN phosphatase YigB (HAD superfamily)